VAQQRLTRRKRRKVEKVRAQKGVTAEVLFGRDLARLADRWSLDELAAATGASGAGQVLIAASRG
jgi:hypothetical protein